jgi:hypothetical protein
MAKARAPCYLAEPRMLQDLPSEDHPPAERLQSDAARELASALGLRATLHHAGQRDRYRCLLASAIDGAERALAVGVSGSLAGDLIAACHETLADAHAAKAEDARHGAGQLSQSAQRAPTRRECDEGWQRVEMIVAGAQASAAAAQRSATEIEQHAPSSPAARRARGAAQRAEAAACAARAIVRERNHAYTFHGDSRFSFGEGWYLAAAAVLAGVAIQIEPGKDGTARAKRFVVDAGLRAHCRPYRSRPRAMKHTTQLVAEAFRVDPLAAQQRLRTAFLGGEPIPAPVSHWVDRRLLHAPGAKRVLVWIRDGVHHPTRNTSSTELLELTDRVQRAGLEPVLIGDALRVDQVPGGAVDMILFWKDAVFQGPDMRRAQLQFFEHMKMQHGLVGQLGVTTAGMDGPALLGLPTMYLTDSPNVRMREWVGAVPGYEEVARTPGYLEQISRTLCVWASSRSESRTSAVVAS